MKGFDITKTEDVTKIENDGQVIHIKDQYDEELFYENGTSEKKPVTITVAGSYSDHFQKAMAQNRDRMMKRGKLPKGDELEERQLNLDASCILAWEGFTAGTQDFPCTRENKLFLLKRAPWIRAQVEEAMSDHQGFFKQSSST